jgi:hypothetical protein
MIMLSMLAVFAFAAVSSSSASAFSFNWEVCQEKAGPGTEPPPKFDDGKCSTQVKALAERKWEEVLLAGGGGKKENVTDKQTTVQKLKVPLAGVEIECKTVVSGTTTKGTLEENGKDTSGDTKYKECAVLKPAGVGCKVKSAKNKPFEEIEVESPLGVKNTKTQLVEAAVGVLADKFSPAGTETTFLTLELGKVENASKEAETKCNATTPLTTAVTGVVVGKVNNATQTVEFTNPAQKGSTLNAFGFTATLEGTIKITSELGGKIKGV